RDRGKECVGQALQLAVRLGCRDTACRGADVRRPDAELAAREGGDRAARTAILQAEIECGVRSLDPLLRDEVRQDRQHVAAYGFRLRQTPGRDATLAHT